MIIWGKSKAIHSTWFFLPTYKLLLDCGEGVSSVLGIHASDVEYVFISHTHLDHISGLVTVGRFQKRTLKREPNRKLCRVLFHPDCSSRLDKLKRFLKDFYVDLDFIPVEDGGELEIKKNIFLRLFRVNHTAPYYKEKLPAFGCHLIEKRTRLRSEFLKEKVKIDKKFTSDKEAQAEFSKFIIAQKEKTGGHSSVMEVYERKMLSYCGDSSPVDVKTLEGTEILMHESTFIFRDEMEAAHSCVEDVVELSKKVKPKALILYHLSERYKRELQGYKEEIHKIALQHKLLCPVYVVGIDDFFRINIKEN